ncbi:hypothetical protein J1N35_021551 [Gossypium stocksii]|uniref:Uncharacterized protein n=1 Tax=Gossypium stocksii TaxID=47602 RepID=A0A9D4A226_9ROSI|nr:hypothetical protein J1N35_021551 [Gossypium stocksii]
MVLVNLIMQNVLRFVLSTWAISYSHNKFVNEGVSQSGSDMVTLIKSYLMELKALTNFRLQSGSDMATLIKSYLMELKALTNFRLLSASPRTIWKHCSSFTSKERTHGKREYLLDGGSFARLAIALEVDRRRVDPPD